MQYQMLYFKKENYHYFGRLQSAPSLSLPCQR